MTTSETNQSIHAAIEIIHSARLAVAGGVCPPAWNKLYNATEYLKKQIDWSETEALLADPEAK